MPKVMMTNIFVLSFFLELMMVAFIYEGTSAVENCFEGIEEYEYEKEVCKTDKKDACFKYYCSMNSQANTKGCGKCQLGQIDGMGCVCFECSDKDMCNRAMRIGPPFVLMWAIIGGVVAILAMKSLAGICIRI